MPTVLTEEEREKDLKYVHTSGGKVTHWPVRHSLRLLDLARPLEDMTEIRPQGWPVKHAATLAELRRRFTSERSFLWSFYPKGAPAGGGKPALAPLTVEVTPDGGSPFAVTLDELAALFGTSKVTPARAARPKAPAVAKVPSPVVVTETPAPVAEPVTPEVRAAAVARVNAELDAYLSRLLHEPKRDYALALVAHLADGAPVPTSDAPWAGKVAAKVTRYAKVAA